MPHHYRPITSSLRSRLLVLTIVFISVIEALIYFPAIAMFRQNFLEDRISAAQIAALSLVEAPFNSVSPQLEEELLTTAGVISVSIRREARSLVLGLDRAPLEVNAEFDLRSPSLAAMIKQAIGTLDAKGARVIRVIGRPKLADSRYMEAIIDEEDLYVALAAFSNNILVLSLIVSLFTGILVYLALHFLMVRPMRCIKESITEFRRHPERWAMPARLSTRRDEIGVVERELQRMQSEIQQNLKQKTRLAELGEAVAKINHDLRNILATTQLASESLARSNDPQTQRIAPRIMRAVNRAVALCERTLKHGRASEPQPAKSPVRLRDMIVEVGDTLGLNELPDFTFRVDIPEDAVIQADSEQFHRVIINLCRNAAEVQDDNGFIEVSLVTQPGKSEIRVRDGGPGIPDSILPDLFKPFMAGGQSRGGTGLGLSIARELVMAHGGHLAVEETGPNGTCFIICLPDDTLGSKRK